MNEGFFSKKQTESASRVDGKTLSCTSCGLLRYCSSPKMQVSGGFKKGIMNIGIAPSETDDRRGKPFQNKSAKLLAQEYEKLGIDLEEDCINLNAVNCKPKDSAPTNYQIDCCRRIVMQAIDKHKPKIIVLFGDAALYSVIGNRWKKDLGNINKWRGWTIPDQDLKAWVCPTFSLEVLTNERYVIDKIIWKQDLKRIAELVGTKLRAYPEPEIIYLKDDLSELDNIVDGDAAFDYETTGLKPHGKGHKIVCASVAPTEDKVFVFPIPKRRSAAQPFKDFLQRESVGKIAQNMKFEDTWTNVRLKVPVNNWVHDTMLATHILDNRPGIVGLKFQTYVQFGVIDYSSDVEPYLKGTEDNANSLNRIEEFMRTGEGMQKVLKYCALDSIYEKRLATLTRKALNDPNAPEGSNYQEAYQLFHDGILSFARVERQGLCIDVENLNAQVERLDRRVTSTETKLYATEFYKDWSKYCQGAPNLNSPTQLAKYLYEIKGVTPMKLTKGGTSKKRTGSTDMDSLKFLKLPALDLMIKRSGYLTLKNTFLKGILKEQAAGILHPFFNLHTARTYRSSSSNINFQNFPKRDEFKMRTIRSCVKPTPGNQLLEMDFSGIEVGIGCAYHQDPTMIKYVSDPTSDMHGDTAEQIFFLPKLDKSLKPHKLLRSCSKNGFVFPQFYGDYYKNNAESICRDWVELGNKKWKKEDGIELSPGLHLGEHMIENGIKTYSQFEAHLRTIEDSFWKERFPVYDKWRGRQWRDYQKKGYVPLKTGFICQGVMDKKNVGNYPIQGAAFHCLLWTFIEVEKELIRRGLKTKLIGQIHDALVFDVLPSELEEVYYLVREIAIVKLPEKYSWINVPLDIDAELCPVDGSWAEKDDWKPTEAVKVSIPEAKHTNKVHYYFNRGLKELWTSYYVDINKEGYLPITKEKAVKIAARYGITIADDGWIHTHSKEEDHKDNLPF